MENNKQKLPKKRFMKWSVRIIFALVFVASLGVCFWWYRSQEREIVPLKTFRWLGASWFNERGMFQMEDYHLFFYNPETGNKVIACNRAGCDHTTKECPASYMSQGVTFTQNGMIFLEKMEEMRFDEMGLYTIDAEGKNLRRLHLFKRIIQISDVLYYDSKVYISYYNSIDQEGNDLDMPEVGIVEYDIESGKEKRIFTEERSSPMIMSMNRNESGIFFTYLYSAMSTEEALEHADDEEYAKQREKYELRYISLHDGKMECLADDLSSFGSVPVVGGKVAACRKDGVYLYGQDKTSVKLESGQWEAVPVYRDGEEQLLLRNVDEKSRGKKPYYIFYETEQEKRTLHSNLMCLEVIGEYAWFMDGDGVMRYGDATDFLQGKEIEEKEFMERE